MNVRNWPVAANQSGHRACEAWRFRWSTGRGWGSLKSRGLFPAPSRPAQKSFTPSSSICWPEVRQCPGWNFISFMGSVGGISLHAFEFFLPVDPEVPCCTGHWWPAPWLPAEWRSGYNGTQVWTVFFLDKWFARFSSLNRCIDLSLLLSAESIAYIMFARI